MAVITSLQRAVSSRHGSASYSKDLTCVCGWVGTACCSLSHVRGAFKRIHMYQPRQLEAFDAQRKSTTLRLERSLRSCRFMNRCVATLYSSVVVRHLDSIQVRALEPHPATGLFPSCILAHRNTLHVTYTRLRRYAVAATEGRQLPSTSQSQFRG